MTSFFHTILFQPLYNALVFISAIVPGHSVALSIIILTIIIRTLLLPLYHKSAHTQRKIKEIEPVLKKIKEDYKDNKEEQARKIMELYREHGINPLSSIFLLFIQLPVILALFYVFSKGFQLNLDILYPFVHSPSQFDNTVFGFMAITDKSYILALLVGITQFFQIKLTLPPLEIQKNNTKPSFQEDFARSMNMQMRYVMPVIITVVASQFPAAVGIYWLTGNIFGIAHEVFVRQKAKLILKSN
ncbi:MAG: hypothetical protein QG665_428 [Patescibacteria group bacterium]|nr:hypothetical protein [Patescibacteria group bacterium]